VVTYVEFAVVHKAVDGGSGGKLSKVSARQREQIAARERHLLDITRVTYHERLGVPKPPESQPKEGGMVVDATAQAELDFDTAPTRVFRRPPLPAEPSLEVAGQRIALPQLAGFNAVILGRRGDVVVAQANETKISGRHATIRSHVVKGERVFEICDGAIGENGQWLSSVNQTKIIRNGKDVPVSDRNFTALQAGDIIVLGSRNGGEVLRIPWHPPTKPNADVHGSDTVVAGSWAKVYPRIAQENQFAEHNFIDGQLTDGIELPSRRVKFLKGAGRFTEKETDNREKTIWDRSKDPVADDFLNEVTAEVREKLGVSNLDPSHPQFEQHLNFAMNYYLARLRAEFRNPKDTGEVIERNSDAFADRYRGESVLVGEFMIQKFPVCRHLTPLTQGFLADLGVRNVRMQRGRLVNGAHVWNEVQINGQRRVIDITLAFGSEKPNQSALLPQGQELLYLPEQKGNASE
jgi:hypothetical protein